MQIRTDYNFLEQFLIEPHPVYLFGTKGVIKNYIPYIKLLNKFHICPKGLVSDDPAIIGEQILGIPVMTYYEWEKDRTDKNDMYILLTSSAERFKKEDVRYLENVLKDYSAIIYVDFPFHVCSLDYPYMRCWSDENSWFYDLLYSGLKCYDDDPCKYIEKVFEHNGLTIQNGIFVMADYESEFVNIKNGRRRTSNQPEEYDNDIYICGSCIAYGDRCNDEVTISSNLQRLLNKNLSTKYCVHNCGAVLIPINSLISLVKSFPLKEGDKVILVDTTRLLVNPETFSDFSSEELAFAYYRILDIVNDYCLKRKADFYFVYCPLLGQVLPKSNFEKLIERNIPTSIAKQIKRIEDLVRSGKEMEGFPKRPKKGNPISFEKVIPINQDKLMNFCNLGKIKYIDLRNYFKRPHEYGEIYSDTLHMSYMGYAYIARIILHSVFEKKNDIAMKESQMFYEQIIDKYLLSDDFKEYLKTLKKISEDKSANAGVIVANCNPFTRGHRYLIETASKQVEQLYVLVVEEDKSFFKFEDRLEMVKRGVKDLENVMVINSGKFVISSLTFPEYFSKETNKTIDFDASNDLFNFCRYIAPALKSKKRFVGEEPLDIVTSRYNDQMKDILPQNGIELIVIPRMESNGTIISATDGRKYIAEKDIDKMVDIFPQSTIQYLEERKLI